MKRIARQSRCFIFISGIVLTTKLPKFLRCHWALLNCGWSWGLAQLQQLLSRDIAAGVGFDMMTREEAQRTLLPYRPPGTSDATNRKLPEALNLAKQDAELSRWLDLHCAQQAGPAGRKIRHDSGARRFQGTDYFRSGPGLLGNALRGELLRWHWWQRSPFCWFVGGLGLTGNGPTADETSQSIGPGWISVGVARLCQDFESSEP